MKKLLATFAAISVILISCQSNSKKYTTVDSSIMSKPQAEYSPPDECFVYNKDKSSASLRMYGSGNKVLGELSYNLYGKDKNVGTIYGVTKGDTITLNYKFQSEGIYSNRQVVFVRKGNQILEGTGDVYKVNGDVKFKNIKNLTFGKYIIFEKTICK